MNVVSGNRYLRTARRRDRVTFAVKVFQIDRSGRDRAALAVKRFHGVRRPEPRGDLFHALLNTFARCFAHAIHLQNRPGK